MQIQTKKTIYFIILSILFSLALTACGGGAEATATPDPTEPADNALPTAPPPEEPTAPAEPEETATTAPLPEPTTTEPADTGNSYPAPTTAPMPTAEGYPAVAPTIAPKTDSAYPAPESLPERATSYKVVAFGPIGSEEAVIEGTEITAVFSETEVNGNAGCNQYFAELIPEGSIFSVGVIGSTEMFCEEPEGVFEQEQAYLEALQNADGYNWGENDEESNIFYTLEDATAGQIILEPIVE